MSTEYPNAIEVEHLVKRFRIYHQGQGSLKRALLELGRKQSIEEYTALKDVSFTVPHGQTVAVVGRNGSGKSTLMSILARVYRQTSGTYRLLNPQGGPAQIAPILELGAGFHPELTGLENIGFYGALMGMTARDMQQKLPSIVEFSELGSKVDTRMHGWNDGAKLRLGFSIAVHTEPDLLLVDEVLAVGDEGFQEKCIGVIQQFQAQGKTIFFVSHDLPMVERVATRVIWLHQGVLKRDGPTAEVMAEYREASHRNFAGLVPDDFSGEDGPKTPA